eukprot:984621-Pelagomonas_calceolata.AAC.1
MQETMDPPGGKQPPGLLHDGAGPSNVQHQNQQNQGQGEEVISSSDAPMVCAEQGLTVMGGMLKWKEDPLRGHVPLAPQLCTSNRSSSASTYQALQEPEVVNVK